MELDCRFFSRSELFVKPRWLDDRRSDEVRCISRATKGSGANQRDSRPSHRRLLRSQHIDMECWELGDLARALLKQAFITQTFRS